MGMDSGQIINVLQIKNELFERFDLGFDLFK